MWVITTDGFYSAVEDWNDPTNIVIRARARVDIDALAERLAREVKVEVSESSDYRYRVRVKRNEWAAYLSEAAEEIDYTNFKDRIAEVDSYRSHQYLDVWGALYRIQMSEQR